MDTIIIKDKVKLSLAVISILLTGAVCFLVYLLLQRQAFDCSDCEGTETIIHDTIWPEKELEPIKVHVPMPVKSVAKKSVRKRTLHTEPKVLCVGEAEDSCQGKAAASVPYDSCDVWKIDGEGHAFAYITGSPCDTINYYSDTIIKPMPDSCIIVVNDTMIDNKVAGRSVWYAARYPMINTTITKTLKEKWKFYAGASFTYNARNTDRWGVGIGGIVAAPKLGALRLDYDIRNNAYQAGLYYLIRIKR